MLKRIKKISLIACSLIATATMTGGLYAISNVQEVSAEGVVASYVSTDTETKSAWETAGYGTDGYLVFGGQKAYSDMYTEQGNNGKTEISLYVKGNRSVYYDATEKSTDSTAPISGFVVNGSASWSDGTRYTVEGGYWVNQPDLYIPGTVNSYPVRLHNNHDDNEPYRDIGIGFTLRETEKIYVTAYVLDWSKKVSETNPITVGLFKNIQTNTSWGYDNDQDVFEEHYGTALVETTVTSQGAYVTFAIEGAGNYQIVAYNKNSDIATASPVTPMITGLFFDGEETEEEPTLPEINDSVVVDAETKSAWETAGYGTDGYLVFGGQKAYSDMYTEQGNNGKTEISLYVKGDRTVYYDATEKSTDSTAPISKLVVNGSSEWKDGSQWTGSGGYFANQPDLYIPGTETGYPVRMHNNHNDDPYCDIGIGFTLRETEKIYVTAYVLDWSKKVSETNPITVGLFKNIQTNTSWGYDNDQDVFEDHYGTALLETTVTSQGAYVTFAIEGAGNYQIVAYNKNSDITQKSSVTPMITGLFFDNPNQQGGDNEGGDNEGGENEGDNEGGNTHPPVLPPIPGIVSIDTETKSAWENAGFGKDGYFIFGRSQDGSPATYSNLYTEQGKDGKTEIPLYRHGDNTYYYSYDKDMNKGVSVDKTAPISNLIINGSSQWKAPTNEINHLYIPGTETTYPLALYNNVFGLYNDLGVGFTLRPAGKTYVTVYVMDRAEQVSESAPIMVALYNKIQATTLFGYGNNTAETLDEHYGTPLVKVAVTENGTYVTFEIDGAGDYQIVAYYDNHGTSTSPVQPMMTGLFFEYETGELANLTYKIDGGEIGPNPKTYVIGKGAKLSDAFKANYTFDGWFTDSAFTNKITEITATQTGDLTLYAKFTRNYREFSITYVADGGEHSNLTKYVWGEGIALMDATKEGYAFIGWYYDNEYFLERAIEISDSQEGDITLYARFERIPQVYNIFYEVDGGTHTNPATYTEGSVFALTNAMKTGYTFEGWYLDGEFTQLITEISADAKGEITLYAKFTKILQTFDITYEVDGGVHSNPATYTEGTAVALTDASKDGYTFDGWYSDDAFTNKVTEIPATQMGAITLYAKFTEIVIPDDSDSGDLGSSSNSGANQKKGGCSGVVSVGVGALGVALAVVALIAKKKED